LKWFLSGIDAVNYWAGAILSYVLLLIVSVTAFEVISRFAFNSPTIWAHETTTQLFGFYIIMGGGYALLCKTHIRVDFLWSRLSLRKRAIMDLVTFGFAFLFIGVLLWQAGEFGWRSLRMLEHTHTAFGPPVYPIKICLGIGTLLLLLQLIVKTIRDLHLAVTGVEDA